MIIRTIKPMWLIQERGRRQLLCSSAQPRAPGLGNDPGGAEAPPALLTPTHCSCRERRKSIFYPTCAMKNHGLSGGKKGGKAGETLGKIGGILQLQLGLDEEDPEVLDILRL